MKLLPFVLFFLAGLYLFHKSSERITMFDRHVGLLAEKSYYLGCYHAGGAIEECKRRSIEHLKGIY